jgi:hypothetical protein
MKRLIYISVLAITLFSTSCTKEYITQGGNADMSTVDFTVQASDWILYGDQGLAGYGYAVDLNFPELTDNVIQNGMVTLYMKSGTAWIPVPVYFYYLSGDVTYQGGFFYRMKKGVFSIDYYESDFQTQNPGTQTFRVVIVQPF